MSYIKETYDFIKFITNTEAHKNCYLVTGDVTSLYAQTAINKVKQIFTKKTNYGRPSQLLIELLQIIRDGNDFKYTGQYYKV